MTRIILRYFLWATILLLTAILPASGAAHDWQPDILGDGFEMRHVDQGEDYSGHIN